MIANFFRVTSLFAVFLLAGCSAMMPSATPGDASSVMQKASGFSSAPVKSLAGSSDYRKPLATGQWVATLSQSKSDPNDVTLQVMKVVRVEGDTVTLETEQYAATNSARRMVMQQTIKNYPMKGKTAYSSDEAAGLVSNIEVEEMKMMDPDGKVTTMPKLPFSFGKVGSDLIKANVGSGAIHTEQCGNEHFRSQRCFVVPYEAKMLWMSSRGTTYAHGQIPILGFITSNSDDYQIDVIGFGDRGATPLIR